MKLDDIARDYSINNVFEINGNLFSNNNDEAPNALKCSKESFIAGFEYSKEYIYKSIIKYKYQSLLDRQKILSERIRSEIVEDIHSVLRAKNCIEQYLQLETEKNSLMEAILLICKIDSTTELTNV